MATQRVFYVDFWAMVLRLVREGGIISGSIAFLEEAPKKSLFLINHKVLVSVKEGLQDLRTL